jgi:DNA-binding LytR/AlgR family response regulator
MSDSTQPTAILADDEPFMRAALRDQLKQLWPELHILRECDDGPSAVRAAKQLKPALAFLDIQMPGLTGLQVAQAVDPAIRIVFVTAHDQHALEAFEANAVDYVLKPLDLARTARLVAKLQRNLEPEVQHRALLARLEASSAEAGRRLSWLQVSMASQIRLVHVDDVMFFESDNKYTRVVAADCDGLIRLSLKELLEQVDETFFIQIHRSTVINRRFVRAIHRNGEQVDLELKGRSERLRVSLANHHLFRGM